MKTAIGIFITVLVLAGLAAAWYFFIYKPGQTPPVDGALPVEGIPVDGTLCTTTDNKPGLFANGICVPQQVMGFGYVVGDRIVAIRDGVQLYTLYGDPITDEIKNRYDFLGCVITFDNTWVKIAPLCGRGDSSLFRLAKKEDVIKSQ